MVQLFFNPYLNNIFAALIFIQIGNIGNYKATESHQDTLPYFQMGMEKLTEGKWEMALKVWAQGVISVEQDKVDPRIGLALIETATKYSASEYYSIAQFAYWQALSVETFHKHHKTVRQEVERVLPIMDNSQQQTIRTKLQKNDISLLNNLRLFWERVDPVVSTEINERLFEHWQRIHTAREKYQIYRETIYHTDDRGIIYVKYGQPQRIHTGSLAFDNSLFRSKASELIDLLNPATGFGIDSSATTLATANTSVLQKDVQLYNLTNKAREYYRNARYEIWIYPPEEGKLTNGIFIFGQDGDSGRFGLLNSVEDMIPNAAFGLRGDQARTMGTQISPGLLLQLIAYHQLSHIDEYFLQSIIDMESKLFSNLQNNSLYLDVAARNQNEFELSRIQAKLPPQYSSQEKKLPKIDVDFSAFRLLDSNNTPLLLISLRSYPHYPLIARWAQLNLKDETFNFSLIHSTRFISSNQHLFETKVDTARIYYANIREGTERITSTNSLFLVPNMSSSTNIISAELYDLSSAKQLPDTSTLFALGSAKLPHPAPLSTDSKRLEMSDLIMGYSKSSDNTSYFLPFVISHNNQIPQDENLVVHFEVYHLVSRNNGIAEFTLTYNIKSKRKGLSKIFRSKRKNDVSLTLNFTSNSSTFKEDLEIKTSKLNPGEYSLSFQVKDFESSQTIERFFTFEITEK